VAKVKLRSKSIEARTELKDKGVLDSKPISCPGLSLISYVN